MNVDSMSREELIEYVKYLELNISAYADYFNNLIKLIK